MARECILVGGDAATRALAFRTVQIYDENVRWKGMGACSWTGTKNDYEWGAAKDQAARELAEERSNPQSTRKKRGGKNVCYGFNSRDGCMAGDKCRFTHQCSQCGSSAHAAPQCPSRGQGATSTQ